jgi:hypothetical protein
LPAAIDRSRQHRNRSTWGLVSSSLSPYQTSSSGINLSRDIERVEVSGNPMKSPFCFGVFWGVKLLRSLFAQVDSRIT